MQTLLPLLLALTAHPSEPGAACDLGRSLEHEGVVYAPCGEAGVGVFALQEGAPVLQALRPMDGQVVGLHVAGGVVWAELVQTRAQPLQALPAPKPRPTVDPQGGLVPGKAPPAPSRVEAVAGKVVEVRAGHVVIDLGAKAGVEQKDRVELYSERQVDVGGGGEATEVDRIAVGVVTAVTDERAKVRLGRNERVPADALARVTQAHPTGSVAAPPRLDGITEIGFTVRPFLALDALGFGALSELRAAHRHESGLTVHAAVEPLGLGFADQGDIQAIDGHVLASYDTRLFELGLGAGWSTLAGVNRFEEDVESSGLSVRQLGRLGARDGVNLEIRNTFLLYADKFHYGGTFGALTWPLTERFALFGRGGGSAVGYAFGELGLRVLAVGAGGHGSLLIDATIGGANLFGDETCTQVEDPRGGRYEECDRVDYGGPMIGFGMEWRR